MPTMNKKNLSLGIPGSEAARALGIGLGDQLIQQVEDETNLRKKKIRELDNMASMTGAVGALLGSQGNVGDGNG